MSVKIEPNGRRSVQVETEVPGTPEQVWQAIATGEGITAWFCPTQVDGRVGGKMTLDMGPGMETQSTITAWEPPRRFAAESPGWMPGMPALATEWTVEARAGGKCLVRVVHSMFASVDDWDNQLEGTESGWPGFFRILRIYLTDFAGQPCSPINVMGMAAGPQPEAWKRLSDGLGLAGAAQGKRLAGSHGTPPLAGTVEHVVDAKGQHSVLVRLEQPSPGVVLIGAYDCGGMVMASVSFYLYGDAGAKVAERDTALWQEWIGKQFPQAEAAGGNA